MSYEIIPQYEKYMLKHHFNNNTYLIDFHIFILRKS
jgi:hypothetical protein